MRVRKKISVKPADAVPVNGTLTWNLCPSPSRFVHCRPSAFFNLISIWNIFFKKKANLWDYHVVVLINNTGIKTARQLCKARGIHEMFREHKAPLVKCNIRKSHTLDAKIFVTVWSGMMGWARWKSRLISPSSHRIFKDNCKRNITACSSNPSKIWHPFFFK